MDVNKSITYPMEQENWVKTVLIGGVLSFLGFLLIPLFIIYGYVIQAIKGSLGGETSPPVFEDWGSLIVEGLQVGIIGIIYLVIPLIVAAVTVGGSIVAMATGTRGGVSAGIGGMIVGLLLTFVLSLVFGYFAVVGIVNFAREERFGAAFDVEVLTDVGLSGDFAIPWLVSVGLFIVVSIVSAIPLIGFLVAPFAGFYAAVVAADLWATGFSQAYGSAADWS